MEIIRREQVRIKIPDIHFPHQLPQQESKEVSALIPAPWFCWELKMHITCLQGLDLPSSVCNSF